MDVKKGNKMNTNQFRNELIKVMPGYKWTVHRQTFSFNFLKATGIKSKGFNRISTLQVTRSDTNDDIVYKAKSAGFSKNAKWMAEHSGSTLKQALRNLQSHYEHMAQLYRKLENDLQSARNDHLESSDLSG